VVGGLFLRTPRMAGTKSRPQHETSTRGASPAPTDATR
jgi:hypothetical protein